MKNFFFISFKVFSFPMFYYSFHINFDKKQTLDMFHDYSRQSRVSTKRDPDESRTRGPILNLLLYITIAIVLPTMLQSRLCYTHAKSLFRVKVYSLYTFKKQRLYSLFLLSSALPLKGICRISLLLHQCFHLMHSYPLVSK